MKKIKRVTINSDSSLTSLFSDDFIKLISLLHDKFSDRVLGAREERINSINNGKKSYKNTTTTDKKFAQHWKVPIIPDDLKTPGIEISGPAHITPMFINALNPGPGGNRAEGYLDDDEDSASHRLEDTLKAAFNRKHAVERTLSYFDERRNKKYSILDGKIPFFMHRERGLHLDEKDVLVDGNPISATLLSTALTLYYSGQSQNERNQGIYFYIPKTESPEEAKIYKDIFDECRNHIGKIKDSTIKAILLVESFPLIWSMEESLYNLGNYSAGLNAARWDLKASLLEYVMSDPKSVWPDRFEVDIKTTPFIENIFRRLVAICKKHDAIPIGGMATALPHKNPEINSIAAESITTDKKWEAELGFIRAWVAHIYHMEPASYPFKDFANQKNTSSTSSNPDDYPITIETPIGSTTGECTRQNTRVLLEYIEGWLNGRGAKGIDRLAGKPGERPALMEDLATARMSVAQIAQRMIHETSCEDINQKHNPDFVEKLITNECKSIINSQLKTTNNTSIDTYKKSLNIAIKWIKNYTEFNFRSLGSYSISELEEIGSTDQKLQ